MFDAMVKLDIISPYGTWITEPPTRLMASRVLLYLTQDIGSISNALANSKSPQTYMLSTNGKSLIKKKKAKLSEDHIAKYENFLKDLYNESKKGKVDSKAMRTKHKINNAVYSVLKKMKVFSNCLWVLATEPDKKLARKVLKKTIKKQKSYYEAAQIKNIIPSENVSTESTTTTTEEVNAVPVVKDFYGIYGNVALTKEEYEVKLIGRHGEKVASEAIDLLSKFKYDYIKAGHNWDDLKLFGDYSSIKYYNYIKKAKEIVSNKSLEEDPFEDSSFASNLEPVKRNDPFLPEINPADKKENKREVSIFWGLLKFKY